MEESEESGLIHESNWATLTFEIPSDSNNPQGTHLHEDGTVHSHDSSTRMPKYLLALGGILLFSGDIVAIKVQKVLEHK